MLPERQSRNVAIALARRRQRLNPPHVYLRFRLRLVTYEITRLERQLENEFATEHTAVLLEELKQLFDTQAKLLSRLADKV